MRRLVAAPDSGPDGGDRGRVAGRPLSRCGTRPRTVRARHGAPRPATGSGDPSRHRPAPGTGDLPSTATARQIEGVAFLTFSDSVHGSWQDVLSFSLRWNVARGFSPLYEPPRESVGHVSLIVPFATLPFRGWAATIELDDPYIKEVLGFIDKRNRRLIGKYGKLFHGF